MRLWIMYLGLALGVALGGSSMVEAKTKRAACKKRKFKVSASDLKRSVAKARVARKLRAAARKWCRRRRLVPVKNRSIRCKFVALRPVPRKKSKVRPRGRWVCRGSQSYLCCARLSRCKTVKLRIQASGATKKKARRRAAKALHARSKRWCKGGRLTPYRNRTIECEPRHLHPKHPGQPRPPKEPDLRALWSCEASQTFKCCR